MARITGRSGLTFMSLIILATLVLAGCGRAGEPLPTLAPAAKPLPSTAVPIQPTLPPPPIITLPAGATGSTAVSVPTGNTNSQVVVQLGGAASPLPAEVQQLLDDLASGALMLNSSPAGQGGEPVNYAYRDLNGDGARDLVVIVVAEPVTQVQDSAEPAGEQVQAISINFDELLASIAENPDAPLIKSAFVYTLSQEELEALNQR